MGLIKWSGSLLVTAVAALSLATGCASGPAGVDGPVPQLSKAPPAQQSGEPRFERGEDGFLYAVGEFDEELVAGQMIYGRHGGVWPLQEMAPPALFAGEVVEVFGDGVAHVHELYSFPDIDRDELTLTAGPMGEPEEMGKGIGLVEELIEVEEGAPTRVVIGLRGDAGVQEGDFYGLVAAYDPSLGPASAQLTRRLAGICQVVDINRGGTTCELLSGHPDHPGVDRAAPGLAAVFLEARFSQTPSPMTVLVSSVDDHGIDEVVRQGLKDYFGRHAGLDVAVEIFEQSVDPRDEGFHRWHRRMQADGATALVGVGIEDRDGEARLVLNYTNVGSTVGRGMVAAPPERGVDMGPVEAIDKGSLEGFSSLMLGSLLVYRGANSEALLHFHSALRDPVLQGKWRWHARDQYAMRWGAFDRFEEAMWLIHEDEAIARDADDEQAYYNALGTRVRLHDFVDQPAMAHQTARQYLDYRRDERPGPLYLSALAMYGEMAMADDDEAAGVEVVEELEELCPDGCEGDLIPMLAGMYWTAGRDRPELQDRIVARMIEAGQRAEMSSMATARMFQGWNFMREDDFLQALIAFFEARRLFDEEGSTYGVGRADFYLALTQIARGEAQEAFDRAMQALEYINDVGDHSSMVRIYERLTQIYIEIDVTRRPQPYLGAAPQILQRAIQAQMSMGDYARAAEAGFGYGHFLFRSGNLDEARNTLQRAVVQGLRVARFDTVALSHVFLAVIARSQGDMDRFHQEIHRARVMAEVADDPNIDDLINDLVAPSDSDQDPTQLL